MRFDSNISIKINKSFLKDYDILTGKFEKNKNKMNCPFTMGKDVFMASVALGYLKNNFEKVKNPHELFKTTTFSIEDCAILKALFLKNNEMNFDSNYTDDNILKQAMGWAESGFKDLKIMTIGEKSLTNLECIVDEIKNTF